jgi:hypothetical protein
VISRYELLRRWFYITSLIILLAFVGELTLLATLGAVESYALIGPFFYVAQSIFFLLGTPALANVLLLGRRGLFLRWWIVAGGVCTIFAFGLVLLQYDVSEALYGIDGTNGPYS